MKEKSSKSRITSILIILLLLLRRIIVVAAKNSQLFKGPYTPATRNCMVNILGFPEKGDEI
jgi:hypothetical protein